MAIRTHRELGSPASKPAAQAEIAPTPPPMLTPANAWRILCRRTGGVISRGTFYRWLNNGKVASIRMGYRFFVPWPALDALIKECLEGERY